MLFPQTRMLPVLYTGCLEEKYEQLLHVQARLTEFSTAFAMVSGEISPPIYV